MQFFCVTAEKQGIPLLFIFDYFFDHQHILSKLDKFSVYFFLLKY